MTYIDFENKAVKTMMIMILTASSLIAAVSSTLWFDPQDYVNWNLYSATTLTWAHMDAYLRDFLCAALFLALIALMFYRDIPPVSQAREDEN